MERPGGSATRICKRPAQVLDEGKSDNDWAQRHQHVLAKLPQEARPQSASHGEHSWTVRSKDGQTAIEVLTSLAFM
eukprot:4344155-Lingulodinium_polyedra.AAC.1